MRFNSQLPAPEQIFTGSCFSPADEDINIAKLEAARKLSVTESHRVINEWAYSISTTIRLRILQPRGLMA